MALVGGVTEPDEVRQFNDFVKSRAAEHLTVGCNEVLIARWYEEGW